MRVGIFYSSITNIHKATHKKYLMDSFKQGIVVNNDHTIEYHNKYQTIDELDAGFILGYSIENNYRKSIIDILRAQRAKIIFVDSNIFSYGAHEHYYHRYSVNSVYPTDGEYFLGDSRDKNKLDKILNYHDLEVKPWRQYGEHILILGQRTLSWNMRNLNGLSWILDIISRVKQHTDRKIIVRLHPGDKTYNNENRKIISETYPKNVSISFNLNIKSDLINAWCSVGYNSTPNCASVIEGVPVYLDDPMNSWAKDVGFDQLNLIETPPMPDRSEWLHKIANIHWNNSEIQSGVYWRRLKNFYRL